MAFLSLLGVVFNILLNPIKEQIAGLRDSHKELKDSHRELQSSQQIFNEKMGKQARAYHKLQSFQKILNEKMDQLLEKQ